MGYYWSDAIVTATGCDAALAPEVEEIMREEHPTLDALSAEEFKFAALRAHRRLKQQMACIHRPLRHSDWLVCVDCDAVLKPSDEAGKYTRRPLAFTTHQK